jgi:uncharacterized protein (TIGR03437 family)
MTFYRRIRTGLALAVLCAGTASGAGPSYSAAGIVNASSFTAGPFAPGSVIAIFGTDLARSQHELTQDDLVPCKSSLPGWCLPLELNYVRVYVQDQPVPLLFVSAGQINFLMPTNGIPGPVTVRVATQGITGQDLSGPYAIVTLVPAAPALFPNPIAAGYVIAQDRDYHLLTADNPAHAGDIVVLYLTGLGMTSPNPVPGEIPTYAAQMFASNLVTLQVTLNGTAVDPTLIKYAGLTPYSAGLYQINLYVPDWAGTDPAIEVFAGTVGSQTGLKLPVQ